MSGTPCARLRTFAGGPVSQLAAALLVPVLAGCGGGGDSGSGPGAAASATQTTTDLGATPLAEGSDQQPQDQRAKDGGNQGSFKTAGQVSANASGQWPIVQIGLSSSTNASFTATISNVRDCATGKFTSSQTQQVEVVDGNSTVPVGFTLSGNPPPNSNPTLCISVTIDGETHTVTAATTVDVPSKSAGGDNPDNPDKNPGENPDTPGGNTPDNPNPGNESPGDESPGDENPGTQPSGEPAPAPRPASPR